MPGVFLRFWIAMTNPVARDEQGQTTAEYALVLIAAAAVAGCLLAWATGTKSISRLFDGIIDKIIPG